MFNAVIAGALLSLAGIVGLAVYTGIGNKKKEGSLSAPVAIGLLMGSVVGGSSTIGTAQLAFTYGMSAWWFTLGACFGCVILTGVFYEPVRRSGSPTLVGVISLRYGSRAGTVASVLNSLGMFINILSQLLSCSAVVLVLFPGAGSVLPLLAGAAVMAVYVVIGGARGAGSVGILKTVLLYSSMLACGIIACRGLGGVSGIFGAFAALRAETGRNYASLFCRGAGIDLGAGASLILGIITTQTYVQALLLTGSRRDARISGYVSAALAAALGVMGIIVGLYMRVTVPDPAGFSTKTALTEFILRYSGMPDLLSGICLGTLFISSVGTGAGLALGISTVIDRELIGCGRDHSRVLILAVLLAAVTVSCLPIGDVILKFAFMSMGLRGCTVFVPLCMGLWCEKKIGERYVIASILISSSITFLLGALDTAGTLALPCDPVFIGVAVSLAVMLAGLFAGAGKKI